MSDPAYVWKCRDRRLMPGRGTFIMGVVNVTPDSFSDGGRFFDPQAAVEHGLRLAAEGAHILDIGGESSRPGSEPVPAAEQIRRIVPVIKRLAAQCDALISVDTMSAETAEAALEAGAHIVNDISGLTADGRMAETVSGFEAGTVLMHMQGLPATMQEAPSYESVCDEVFGFLVRQARRLEAAGIARDRICLDPGIGFGKTQEHNIALLRGLPQLRACGYPVLVGVSRKSLIGFLTGREVGERLAGSLGAAAFAALNGADILRVHDVRQTRDLLAVTDALDGKCGSGEVNA